MMRFLIHGEMTELPAPYAPSNYHHPVPTLACIEKCLKRCFPGITKIKLSDESASIGRHPATVAISVEHNYQGDAQTVFANGLVQVVRRHVPKTNEKTALLLNFLPPIYRRGDSGRST